MNLPFVFLFGLISLFCWSLNLNSQTLNTNRERLSTGSSLSTGAKRPEFKPVPGSSILFTSHDIEPDSPSEFLISHIRKLEEAVANYDLLPEAKQKETDEKIKRLVSQVLDLEHLARQALSAGTVKEGKLVTYWEELGGSKEGATKRQRYGALFKKLVEENYLEKARTYMSGKYKIPLVGETQEGEKWIVRGQIEKQDADLVLEFKLAKPNGVFRVTDVKLDETSLESTYRGSFNRIIRNKGGLEQGFSELMGAMQKRLDELKKGGATRL